MKTFLPIAPFSTILIMEFRINLLRISAVKRDGVMTDDFRVAVC